MLYGQVGYAVIGSTAGTLITISTAEWAPGIWAGAENMPIEIRDLQEQLPVVCQLFSFG
jgi:hypothetical protein